MIALNTSHGQTRIRSRRRRSPAPLRRICVPAMLERPGWQNSCPLRVLRVIFVTFVFLRNPEKEKGRENGNWRADSPIRGMGPGEDRGMGQPQRFYGAGGGVRARKPGAG